jgi:GTP pyrophosphokinase
MHQVSEVGIAAHWRYKEGRSPTASTTPSWPGCASSWTGSATSSDATEFVEGIKLDIFQDQVFVFTPKGDIKDLPAAPPRSTSPTASTRTSATARSGPRSTTGSCRSTTGLKNGDIVEIVTTKGEHGPSRDWLNVVKTSHAREKIRQWFKRKDRDENIVHGGFAGARAAPARARPRSRRSAATDREVAKQLQLRTVDDFYAAIGYGAIGAQTVVMRLGVVDDVQSALPTVAAAQQPSGPAASGSRASATCWSASPSAATRSRATRSSASSPAARA